MLTAISVVTIGVSNGPIGAGRSLPLIALKADLPARVSSRITLQLIKMLASTACDTEDDAGYARKGERRSEQAENAEYQDPTLIGQAQRRR